MVIFLSFWVIGSIFVTMLANSKGQNPFLTFFGCMIFSPFLMLILVLIAKKGNKVCPKCAEKVKLEALKCKHCGFEFVETEADRIKALEEKTSKVF